MRGPLIRPTVHDVVFQVHDRILHPEFFPTLHARQLQRESFRLIVRLTTSGHVLEWTSGSLALSETMSTTDMTLPENGRHFQHRFTQPGERRGRYKVPGVHYEVSLQLEVLPPEVYLHVHQELADDGARRGVLFHFQPNHRLGLTPLSFVTVEPVATGISVAAFHTFPDEFAVWKSQSLIEFARADVD